MINNDGPEKPESPRLFWRGEERRERTRSNKQQRDYNMIAADIIISEEEDVF